MPAAVSGLHCSEHKYFVFGAMQRAIMMQSLKQSRKKGAIFLLAFLVCFSFLLVVAPILVYADDFVGPPAPDPYGLEGSAGQAGLKTPAAQTPLPSRIGTIVGIALSFVGVLFLILIIYAGISWMTAAGNDQQVAKSKEIIIAAVIGLVIIFSAYAITNFVGTNLAN